MRHLALADLTQADLAAMLAENETLFVEHKGALAGSAARAMCSFANTLGGWVLIGVTDSAPNEGRPHGWQAVPAYELTDRVRECLKTQRVDPIPAFAATVPSFCKVGQRIGVIRVYESDDAPHVIGNGQVLVRSVAEDQKQRVYRAGGVETQAVLMEMVERGHRGFNRARERLWKFPSPFVSEQLGFSGGNIPGLLSAPAGGVMLRAAPVTRVRLEDWAVSRAANDALVATARGLVGSTDRDAQTVLHASGLAARIASERVLCGLAGEQTRRPVATTVADAAGLVGASMSWGNQQPPRDPVHLTLDGFKDQVLLPVLDAVCDLLSAAELYGRSALELAIGNLQQLAVFDETGRVQPIPQLSLEAVIELPLEPGRGNVGRLAERWRDDLGRAAGYQRYR